MGTPVVRLSVQRLLGLGDAVEKARLDEGKILYEEGKVSGAEWSGRNFQCTVEASIPGSEYLVRTTIRPSGVPTRITCTCPYFAGTGDNMGVTCKHIVAAVHLLGQGAGRPPAAEATAPRTRTSVLQVPPAGDSDEVIVGPTGTEGTGKTTPVGSAMDVIATPQGTGSGEGADTKPKGPVQSAPPSGPPAPPQAPAPEASAPSKKRSLPWMQPGGAAAKSANAAVKKRITVASKSKLPQIAAPNSISRADAPEFPQARGATPRVGLDTSPSRSNTGAPSGSSQAQSHSITHDKVPTRRLESKSLFSRLLGVTKVKDEKTITVASDDVLTVDDLLAFARYYITDAKKEELKREDEAGRREDGAAVGQDAAAIGASGGTTTEVATGTPAPSSGPRNPVEEARGNAVAVSLGAADSQPRAAMVGPRDSETNGTASAGAAGDGASSPVPSKAAPDRKGKQVAETTGIHNRVAAETTAATTADDGRVPSPVPEGVPSKPVPEGVPSKPVPEGVPSKPVPEGVPSKPVPEGVPSKDRSDDGSSLDLDDVWVAGDEEAENVGADDQYDDVDLDDLI